MHNVKAPYLVFLGEEDGRLAAKTGLGVVHWARERCVGQWRLSPTAIDLGLADMAPEEAAVRGARSLVVGVANIGGEISPSWRAAFEAALAAGLDIVSGMHQRLGDDAALAAMAAKHSRAFVELRKPPCGIPIATGKRRPGRRVLTVGTDCASGKKYTALAVWRELRARGVDADFCATGQTGVLISGKGFAIDSVVSDFIAGAAEIIAPANAPAHWDVIEGQGTLFHPAYGGVSLGLLHGAQPEAIIMCHEAGRTRLSYYPDYPTPDLATAIDRHLEAARLTSPDVYCAGVSLNTQMLDEAAAREQCAALSERLAVPVTDPVRFGASPLTDELLKPRLRP